jgi:pimeloyl-ACP methyl ester carboxylesterase
VRFLFVHGAFHGGWCWDRVTPHLVERGHSCTALDLPGHGSDRTPLAAVTYAMNVAALVDQLQAAHEPVTVVAHSLGGISATEAAAAVPDRVSRLVYVSALVPLHGERMADLPQRDPSDPVGELLRRNDADGVMTFRKDGARQALFNECEPSVADWAAARLEDESIAATEGVARFPAGTFPAGIPRSYVVCVRDRTITARRQQAILRRARCESMRVLIADHSPFLSRPQELAQVLVSSVADH